MHSPFTKIRYILTFASSSLEQFLRATWGAVSLAIVLTLPQIRLNSQPSQCVFFFFKLTVSCLWSWMRWLPKLLSISSSQAPLTTVHFARLEPCLPLPAKSWQLAARVPYVVEPKFTCLTHSEVKQTKRSEFGEEDGLLLDQARRTCGFCSKESSMVFREEFLKAKYWMRVAGLWLSSDWLWWRHRAVLQDSCTWHYHPPPPRGSLFLQKSFF